MITSALPRCLNKNTSKEIYKYLGAVFSRIDAFSQKPELRVLEQQSFSTILGQLMTVILMTVCLMSFASALQSTVNHNSPSIMQSQEIVVETEVYSYLIGLSVKQRQLYIRFELLRFNSKQPSQYFTIYSNSFVKLCHTAPHTNELEFEHYKKVFYIQISCTSYQMQICDREKSFKTDSQINFFAARNLSNYYCINSTQWDQRPMNIQGSSQSNTYQYITLTTVACKNSTMNNNSCQTPEKINSYIQGVYYLFIIDGVLSQVSNFSNPFEQYITIKSTQLSMSQSKQINHNLNINQVTTDTGLIFKDTSTHQSIGLSNIQIEGNTYNGQYLSMQMISITGIKYTYSRSYPKLQAILGQLGGLWQVTIIVFGMFINPLARKMLYLNMANGLFDLQYNEKGLNSKCIENADQERRALRDFFKKRVSSIRIDPRTVCSFIFNTRSTKRIQNAHLKIMTKLDLQYILNKLIEIDQLKEILLTEEQNHLFRYLQRPQINLNENQPYDQLIEQAHQAYLKTYDNEQLINQNLMLKLDPDLVGIFQHMNQKFNLQMGVASINSERLSMQGHPDEKIELESKAQIPKFKI